MQGPEAHLERALAGDDAATQALVAALLPAMERSILRALLARGRSARGRQVRQEIADIAQDALLELFADGGRVLRTWDPARGLALASFAALVAERKVSHVLRSQRRSPWTEDPQDHADFDAHAATAPGVEARLGNRQLLRAVYARLREELSPLGMELFAKLVVEDLDVDQICADMAMTRDAVYAWRSRLLKRTRTLARELEPPSSRRRAHPQEAE